jgi:hypothetical protein
MLCVERQLSSTLNDGIGSRLCENKNESLIYATKSKLNT